LTEAILPRPGVRGPRATMAITLPGLAACFVAFALAPHDQLLSPLTLVLAGCAVIASVAWIDLDDRLLVDASFVPSLLAIGFLGPAEVVAVLALGEICSWCIRRYRAVVVPINMFGLIAPALLAATAFDAIGPRGALFYVALGLVGAASLALNGLMVTSLMGVLDDAPIIERLRGHLNLIPALAINLGLALATATLYGSRGLIAITVVLVAIIAFNYMVTQMIRARQRGQRISDLAASRHRLVVEALDAEDRERRRLSERLHDEAIQALLTAKQELAEAKQGDPHGVPRAQAALDSVLNQLRGAVFDLDPRVLEHGGIEPALRAVAEQQGRIGRFRANVAIDEDATGRCDRLVFAVSRELLTNIAKHASARFAQVRIFRDGPTVVITVSDDGRGFESGSRFEAVREGHIGIASIAERIEAIGGCFDLRTSPGHGVSARAVLPVAALEPSNE
jgi:signal transduction histidine kinase